MSRASDFLEAAGQGQSKLIFCNKSSNLPILSVIFKIAGWLKVLCSIYPATLPQMGVRKMLKDKSLLEDFDLVEELEDKTTEVISGGMLITVSKNFYGSDLPNEKIAAAQIEKEFNVSNCQLVSKRHVGGSCYCADSWKCVKGNEITYIGGDPDCGMYNLPNACYYDYYLKRLALYRQRYNG